MITELRLNWSDVGDTFSHFHAYIRIRTAVCIYIYIYIQPQTEKMICKIYITHTYDLQLFSKSFKRTSIMDMGNVQGGIHQTILVFTEHH